MDFHKVEAPVFFPAVCHVCGNQSGAHVDTLVEDLNGRIYLCERCVRTAALKLGWTQPSHVVALRDQLGEMEGYRDALLAELEAERAKPQLLSLDDLRALSAERKEPKPKATA